MANSPLLPLLKEGDGNKVTHFDEAGTWQNREPVELERISQSLQVVAPDANYSEIDSIPNMWARPLLFEMALYDDQHPIHERIVGEWRGLLAMLALKEWYGFPLTVEPIEIPESDDLVPADADLATLLQALGKLLPQHTLDKDTKWDQLYLILFDNAPIGLTSPTTLVCTAADCFGYISDVPWSDGQFLLDPTSKLLQEQKVAVAGWLKHLLEKQINPRPSLDPDLTEGLHKQISEFSEALGGMPDTSVPLSDHGLGLIHGLFHGMNDPVAAKDFFTEKLFVIRGSNAFHENGVLLPQGSDALSFEEEFDGEAVTPILPIKDKLLTDTDVTSLSERMVFKETPTGVVVKLKLPETDFVIVKEYRFERKEIVEIPTVPVLEIWPNFKRSDWQVYYTYFTTSGQVTFYAKPFLPDEKSVSRPFCDDQGNIEKEITRTSHLPEAMLCKYKNPNSPDSDYEEAGVLLISTPKTESDGEGSWTVGVDFGTTSTTIYRNDPNAGPQTMEFNARLLQVTNSSERNRLYDDFIPDKTEPTPFLSLFQSFPSLEDHKKKPLFDGHIYFLADYKELTEKNVVSNLKWSANPNDRILAWVFLEQLCLQCAAEAVVGGAKKINWRFSFPIAFSNTDRTEFQEIWSQVTEACAAETGLEKEGVSSEPESIVAAKFFASNRQSKDATGAFATGAVCIDIGGETSDISIWQDNKLYWQTSLRFAGRHIFLNGLTGFLEDPGDEKLLKQAKEKGESNFYAQADALIKINGERWLENLLIKSGAPKVQTFVEFIATGIAGLLYYVGLIIQYLGEKTNFKHKMPSVYIGGNGSQILHWLSGGKFGPPIKDQLKQVLRDASKFDSDDDFDLEISETPKEEAAFGLVDAKTILEWDEAEIDLILAGEGFIENGQERRWTEILDAERFGNRLETKNKLEQIENFVKSFNNNLNEGRIKAIKLSENNETIYQQLQNQLTNLEKTEVEKRHIEPLFILALKELLKLKTGFDSEKKVDG